MTSGPSTYVACKGTEIRLRGHTLTGRYLLLRCDGFGMQSLDIDENPKDGFDEYWDEISARVYRLP